MNGHWGGLGAVHGNHRITGVFVGKYSVSLFQSNFILMKLYINDSRFISNVNFNTEKKKRSLSKLRQITLLENKLYLVKKCPVVVLTGS